MDIDILQYRMGYNVQNSYDIGGDDIISYRNHSLSSSSKASKKVVDILETSSGLVSSSIPVEGICDKLLKSGTTIVTCDSKSGSFTCYDIESKLIKGHFQKKLKTGQHIESICSSRETDGFYFFTCSGESIIYGFILKDDEDDNFDDIYNDSNNGIILFPGFNIDKKGIFDNTFKGASITSINSHPTLPCLIIVTSLGVQVWSYSNLLRFYYSDVMLDNYEEEDDAPGDVDDNSSTTASVTGTSVSGTRSKQKGSVFTDNQKAKKKELHNWLIPRALILPPSVGVDASKTHITISDFSIEASGRLIAINWDRMYTVLYDIRSHVLHPNSVDESGALNALKPLIISRTSLPYVAGPLAFHPSEPLLFQSVIIGKQIVLNTLSLIDLSLSVLGRYELQLSYTIGKILSIQCTSISGHVALAFQNPSKSENYYLKIYSLTAEWRRNVGCASVPTISRLGVSMDIFVDGDASIASREESSRLKYSLLMIRSSIEMSEANTNSMKYAHNIFGLTVANDPSPCKFVGSIDFLSGKSSNWMRGLSDDDLLQDNQYFIPNTIRLNDVASAPNDAAKIVIVKGVSWSREKSNEKASLRSAISLLKHSNDSLQTTYSTFRDAHFLNDVSDKLETTLLVLCSSGFSLKSFSLSPSGDLCELSNWKLQEDIVSFWPSPAGTSRSALFATAIKNQVQSVIISNTGDFGINSLSRCLKLAPMERVLDVQWQPAYSLKKKGDTNASNGSLVFEPLLAILTNSRLMLLTSKLDILNMHIHGLSSSNKVKNNGSRAMSIYWLGSALIFASESGRLSYLLPNKYMAPSNFRLNEMFACLGLDSKDLSSGNLFTLPRHVCLTGALQIGTMLPDRIIIAYSSIDVSSSVTSHNYLIRPCLSVEPVIMGLLANRQYLDLKSDASEMDDDRYETLKALVITYFTGLQPSLSKADNGAYPSTQSTRKLVLALSAGGFPTLASITGINGGNGNFTGTRWIPAPIKMKLATDLSMYELGCSELFSAKTEVRDQFLYPDSDNNGGVTCVWSSGNQQYSNAAQFLINCGQQELASRIAHVAGIDLTLNSALKNHRSDLDEVIKASKGKDIPIQYVIKNHISGNDDVKSNLQKFLPTSEIHQNSIAGYSKQSLLQSVSYPVAKSDNKDKDLKSFVESEKSKMLKNGSGNAFTSKCGTLSMDWLEDWVGARTRLELISYKNEKNYQSNEPLTDENTGMPEGLVKPSTWVDDIGKGKEWDKVVGYWRFSDAVHSNDEDFTNSGIPGARIALLDLSKYSGNLELFCEDGAINLEESTSFVDPGEDHATVKFLYDVVFSKASANVKSGQCPSHGLRTVIHRGSPLDVGLFHVDPDRSKLTIEICVFFDGANHKIINNNCLIRRVRGSPPINVDDSLCITPIWEVFVNTDGSVSFNLYNEADNPDIIKTEPNIIPFGSDKELETGIWSHIVVVIDSTAGLSAGSDSISSNVAIQLYVNGDDVAGGVLKVERIPESFLAQTTLYVGPDLSSGWRLTELRLWAETRTQNDVNALRENYLALASKRKRLHYQIKGKKGLFGKLNAQSLEIGPPTTAIVLSSDRKVSDSNQSKESTSESKFSFSPGPLLKGRTPIVKPIVRTLQAKSISLPPPLPTTTIPNSDNANESTQPSSAIETSSNIMNVIFDFAAQNLDARVCSVTKSLSLPDVFCVRNGASDFSLIKLKSNGVRSKPIKVNSGVTSILYSPRPSTDQNRTIVAAYDESASNITIYAHDDARIDDKILDTLTNMSTIISQKVPTLHYWIYSGLDTILMITESAAYSWKADGRQAKPAKLLDRIDQNKDLRRVIDCAWTLDGWLMLTTAQKQEKSLSSHLISIYNVKNGRSFSLHAISGCFVGSSVAIEHLSSTSKETNSRSISLFDLSSLASTKTDLANSSALNIDDLVQLNDNAPIKIKWSTKLDTYDDKEYADGNILNSILCAEGDTIFHLNCYKYTTTIFNTESGTVSTTVRHSISPNHKVFSYHFDNQRRKHPSVLLLIGEGCEKPQKIIKLDLINKHI